MVVAFKNLSKKDGTTKSRALEDLRAYIQAHQFEDGGGPEEAILEAWVRLRYLKCLMCQVVIPMLGQILSSSFDRQFAPSP